MNYRILGVRLSAVEQQDTHRKDKVKQLIEKFENFPNKESFLQDFKQTKEINKFSEESQDLIVDMNNTEIFVLCETSSKTAMSRLQLLLGSRHCLLIMRKMLRDLEKCKGGRQEQQRCSVDTWLCYQEE